ncbi:AAA family ATPase [Actinocrispum wychmicini]|uniref:AAA family ATPase n=1 Tax=Actinocrispum wychmicini TaxID=1213861 RepID=UPI001049DEA4|nr:AAA family ATPase [Actinocrispum wychmicini]
MLLWINGPFGGGKTQTVYEIHRRLPHSVVCDPEHVGFGLQRMAPPSLRGDFQDFQAWRQGVREVLDRALTKHEGTVIAPMTLVEPGYFQEIIGGLRDDGHDVRHFALLADRERVLRRLRVRGLGGLGRESFAVSKLDVCLQRLREPGFGEHVRTDRLTIPQVADRIAACADLTLTPNTDGALRGRLRRAWTSIKHIRFD